MTFFGKNGIRVHPRAGTGEREFRRATACDTASAVHPKRAGTKPRSDVRYAILDRRSAALPGEETAAFVLSDLPAEEDRRHGDSKFQCEVRFRALFSNFARTTQQLGLRRCVPSLSLRKERGVAKIESVGFPFADYSDSATGHRSSLVWQRAEN